MSRALSFLDSLEPSLTDRAEISGSHCEGDSGPALLPPGCGAQYLTLSRAPPPCPGGESQRIRLATQIGSYLVGVLYILDEPSIGLHQRDNDKLLTTLKHLRDLGNTLIVVEHDEDTMRAADYIVDIGPGAGVHGGNVICSGPVEEVCACKESVTGQYLSGRRRIPVPAERRPGSGRLLTVRGASENNLKNIDVSISAWGRSIASPACPARGNPPWSMKSCTSTWPPRSMAPGPGQGARLHRGLEALDKVIDINQAPIGRTPRSNPATYTGLFNDIRELFAATADAKMRGFSAGRFSFNIKGGAARPARATVIVKIEMHFLPDVYVPCEVCNGRRYNRETLEVKYKGKNLRRFGYDGGRGALFFPAFPRSPASSRPCGDVGLGYIQARAARHHLVGRRGPAG